MAHSKKRLERAAAKRTAKANRIAAAGTNAHKRSGYAQKLARKNGNGKRLLGWMWWTQADGAAERELAAA